MSEPVHTDRHDHERRREGRLFLGLPAPAKLNLFLHVVGRRADGYHELQSLMVPISLADTLDFGLRDDGNIVRTGDVVGPVGNDLCLRAARLLKDSSATPLGAEISVEKRIPAGSGMGGGSSDAATTLLALNRLWDQAIAKGRAYGTVHNGGWCDVGHPGGIALAEALLANG